MDAIRILVSLVLVMVLLPPSAIAVSPRSLDRAKTARAAVLGSLVREHLPACNLVLLGDDVNTDASDFVSTLDTQQYPRVLLQVGGTPEDRGDSSDTHYLLQKVLTERIRSSCLSLVLYASSSEALDLILSVLEDAGLFLHPDTYLLWLGPENLARQTLDHAALRNSVNVLYLARRPMEKPRSPRTFFPAEPIYDTISKIFTRCLYCDSGNPKTYPLPNWHPRSGFQRGVPLFPNQFKNFDGHTFRIVTMPWFPYIELEENPEDSSGTLKPLDSLDYRMVDSISKTLNFTFEYRKPSDGQWGQSTPSGNWTGTVGTLQHHLADFSCILAWMESRYAVVQYSRIYSTEQLVMIMSKPKALPQWQALMRPFETETWVAILVIVGVVGLSLWTLQRGWACVSGQKVVQLDTALLQAWAIILEDPPTNQPSNVSGQMMIGWWWMCCMLITIVYKSALTAHLTIPGKSPTIDTFEQLLAQDGWTWGFEPTYGNGWQYFKTSTNPTVKSIFEGLQVMEFEDQMNRVLAGRHAFLTWKYYIQYRIAARYTNAFGYTPIYKAKQEYLNYGGYGWGFRKGAPFRKRFDEMTQRLLQAGLIDFWLDDLIITRARRERQQQERKAGSSSSSSSTEGGATVNTELRENTGEGVILSVHHLQGAFYLLMICYLLALVALLGEVALNACRPKK